jgi:hypothetical protein
MAFDLKDNTTSAQGCSELECSRRRRLYRQHRLPWCRSQNRPSQRHRSPMASLPKALEGGAIRCKGWVSLCVPA